jgi:hypothetical protein
MKHNRIQITEVVKEELEEKDSDTLKEDLKNLNQTLPEEILSRIEFVKNSAFEEELKWFLREVEIKNFSDLQKEIERLDMDLEDGEVSCYVICKDDGSYVYTEDFDAYNEFFERLDGNVMCLCQVIMTYLPPNKENQRLVKILETVFTDKSKLDSYPRDFLDQRIRNFTKGVNVY